MAVPGGEVARRYPAVLPGIPRAGRRREPGRQR